MGGLGLGWILIGLSLMTILASGVIGALTFDTTSPRLKVVRSVSLMLGVAAAVTLIVIAIVGPGPWCGDGSAYTVPGCA